MKVLYLSLMLLSVVLLQRVSYCDIFPIVPCEERPDEHTECKRYVRWVTLFTLICRTVVKQKMLENRVPDFFFKL